MPILTFRCDCGWQGDSRVGWGISSMPCPTCGHEATQASVYRVAHVGLARTPTSEIDYRQDFKDFTEASAELEFKHSRMEEAAGRTIATPPLATLGMKKARELQAKGVRDSLDYKARG